MANWREPNPNQYPEAVGHWPFGRRGHVAVGQALPSRQDGQFRWGGLCEHRGRKVRLAERSCDPYRQSTGVGLWGGPLLGIAVDAGTEDSPRGPKTLSEETLQIDKARVPPMAGTGNGPPVTFHLQECWSSRKLEAPGLPSSRASVRRATDSNGPDHATPTPPPAARLPCEDPPTALPHARPARTCARQHPLPLPQRRLNAQRPVTSAFRAFTGIWSSGHRSLPSATPIGCTRASPPPWR